MLRSVDIFDTVLTRAVARPADLFLLSASPSFTDPEQWRQVRIQAERHARQSAPGGEVNLEQIYRALADSLSWDAVQTRQAMEAELAAEETALHPVPGMRRQLRRWREQGDSILFLSDMYLPSDFLERQLRHHGVWAEGDQLLVSGEQHLSKRSGQLFLSVLQSRALSPGSLCHTGDDPEADASLPSQFGIRTEPFTDARLSPREQFLSDMSDVEPLLRSRIAAASRLARLNLPKPADPEDRTLRDIGTAVIGPLLTGYVAWSLREAKQRGIQRLYFVSRDGQILHRIAETLCRTENLDIECRYLFGSRQAWHLPALTKLDETALNWIVDSTLHLSIDSVLRRVGLDPACAGTPLTKNGFPESAWTHNLEASERDRLKLLLSQDPLRSAILTEAESRRKTAAGYLRQEGLLDSIPWAMVDMGWSGRMQGSLRSLLNILGANRPVTGFYFALKGTCPATNGNTLLSCLDPSEFAAKGLRYIPVLETITAADHASVVSYQQKSDGHFGPVFHPRALEARNFPWVRIQQDAAVAFAEKFGQLISVESVRLEDIHQLAALLMRQFFGSPTREESRAYRLFRAGEDQAGGRLYRLATPITPQRYWAALLRGGSFLYRLRWPEACIAGSLNHPRLRIALLHGRQVLAGWKKHLGGKRNLLPAPEIPHMKILWFPRLQYDVDRLHLVTWREMAWELKKQGHSVRVAVAGIPRNATPTGWIRLPLLPIKGLRLLGFWVFGTVAFLWQFLTIRPDLILLDVQSAGFGFPFALFSRRTKWILDQRTPIAHTSTPRSALRLSLEKWMTDTAIRFARRHFDGLTVITETFRKQIVKAYGIPLEQIGIWGSGVQMEIFNPAQTKAKKRAEDLRGRFVVFQHGELSTNRGLLETVRALAEPGMENVLLTLLGKGPAREAIQQVARECHVEDRVRLLPPVPHAEIPAHLTQCDCAILAYPVDDYWNCNDPIKFIEFLAMGKVVVCTPLAIVHEAGLNARFLEVIPDNRPESIAKGIRACMEAPDLQERGLEGMAYAHEHGTWTAQAKRLMDFVRQQSNEAGNQRGIPLVIFHPMDPRGSKVGGAETFVRGLIQHAPSDFDVTLIGLSATEKIGGEVNLMEGDRPFRFRPILRVADENRRGLIPLSLRYTLALWPLRKQFQKKVLFFNRIEPLLLFRAHRAPTLVAVHNDVQKQISSGSGEVLWSRFPRLYFAMENRCLPSANLILSVSHPTADNYRQRFPAIRDRIEQMSTWFDSYIFRPPKDRAEKKKGLSRLHPPLRPRDEWILFAGRFQPQKAPLRMIEAFGLVQRQRPAVKLLLIGDGNLKAEMIRKVTSLGLQVSVLFLGSMPPRELAAFYQAADAFLLASDYEGMPISVLEALACGLPVASTPVGEVPALVTPGITGEIAAACSADALASALEELLSHRARYTDAACAAAVQNFTPDQILAPLYDRIRSLAHQGIRSPIR